MGTRATSSRSTAQTTSRRLSAGPCRRARPSLVSRSLFSGVPSDFLAFVVALRQGGYAGHITAGGRFGTFAAREIMADFPELDSVCVQEAEATFTALAEHVADGRSLEGDDAPDGLPPDGGPGREDAYGVVDPLPPPACFSPSAPSRRRRGVTCLWTTPGPMQGNCDAGEGDRLVEVDLSWTLPSVVVGSLLSVEGIVLLESSSTSNGARLPSLRTCRGRRRARGDPSDTPVRPRAIAAAPHAEARGRHGRGRSERKPVLRAGRSTIAGEALSTLRAPARAAQP